MLTKVDKIVQVFLDHNKSNQRYPKRVLNQTKKVNPYLRYPNLFWMRQESLAKTLLLYKNTEGDDSWEKKVDLNHLYGFQWSIHLFESFLNGKDLKDLIAEEAMLCEWSLEDLLAIRYEDLRDQSSLLVRERNIPALTFLVVSKITAFVFSFFDSAKADFFEQVVLALSTGNASLSKERFKACFFSEFQNGEDESFSRLMILLDKASRKKKSCMEEMVRFRKEILESLEKYAN